MHKTKEAIETGRAWDKDMKQNDPENIQAVMKLIEQALKAKDADGTKKKKVSYMAYWTTFCAAYGMDGEVYGGELPSDRTALILTVQEEMATLTGFNGYVVIFPRRKGKAHNSVSHGEGFVGVVRAYYRGRSGRTPGTGAEANFGSYVKEALI